MELKIEMLTHPQYDLYVRQFGEGAARAALDKGVTVIIDNYRASNTILALLDAGVKQLIPVERLEEINKYPEHIIIGEDQGVQTVIFDYDNSPAFINSKPEIFRGKNVILRTTNGTRGIIQAIGSQQILIGSFRNLTAIIQYLLPKIEENIPVSFIAMGTLHQPRIEDYYCGYMMFYEIAKRVTNNSVIEENLKSESNPWNTNWKEQIVEERASDYPNQDDWRFCLQLDTTKTIPIYDIESKSIKVI